ncbi:unnamed protein product [Agarophyton chilense]
MASGHARRQWLEAFKFSVYVVTPIAATVYLGTGAYPYLEKIIRNTSYIVYPPEGDTPPTSTNEIKLAREKRISKLQEYRADSQMGENRE